MAYTYHGRLIRPGQAWTDANNIQHPSNWMVWDDATKASKGLVYSEEKAPYDNRFYLGYDTDDNLIERNLPELKAQWTQTIKQQAGSLLASTDWYVVREVEEGTNCPTNIKNYRRAVRLKSNEIERLIDITINIEEFKALFENVDNGNAPINDWPELED